MQPSTLTDRRPKLVAVDGPLRGHVFEVDDGPWGLGRGNANRIFVDDPSLSRLHCTLEWRGGELWLKDLDSHNGTFLNGAPVREHVVQDGDEIQAGRSVFRVLGREGAAGVESPSVRFEGSGIDNPTLLALPSQESVYLKPGEGYAGVPSARGAMKGYQTLLRVAEAVHASGELEPLADALLQVLLGSMPAERAALLLFREGEEEPFLVFTRDRTAGAGVSFEVNRAAVDRALEQRHSILSGRALLAAPLLDRQRALGVVYLDAAGSPNRLDPDDLQLLAAAGVICGPPIANALEFGRIQEENRELREEIHIRHEMVGESAAMQEVYRLIGRVASTDSSVLILGETGTGKELVARAIHRNSAREKGPFVAINCASLTENLLESELFGHERGAFTGAVSQKRGKLELADRGTLFLDEIGELPSAIQSKLLRVLQEREFERLGGTRTIRVDLRILAATNRDLRAAAATGAFRDDLYYRLNVVAVRLPALRDRRDDIPLLANYFLSRCNGTARRVHGFSTRAAARLQAYDWPGNVRELQHAVESAIVMGEGDWILPEDLPESVMETAPAGAADGAETYHGALQQQKSELILAAVEEAGGSITGAAKLLRLHPNYLHRLIRNLGLRDRVRGTAS
jgi:Nif-specific regulatory protein